jgi:hypothetical protein
MQKDKLKKYSVTVSKTISVLASDAYEAEEQARADFDCTDLDFEVDEWVGATKSELKKEDA